MKKSIVFYQPLSSQEPFIVVFQNEEQRNKTRQFGNSLVFLDATYSGWYRFTKCSLIFLVGIWSFGRDIDIHFRPIGQINPKPGNYLAVHSICIWANARVVFRYWACVIRLLHVAGISAYGFSFFGMLVRDDHGHGYPIGYFITSTEDTEILKTCLQKFKDANPGFYPRLVADFPANSTWRSKMLHKV